MQAALEELRRQVRCAVDSGTLRQALVTALPLREESEELASEILRAQARLRALRQRELGAA